MAGAPEQDDPVSVVRSLLEAPRGGVAAFTTGPLSRLVQLRQRVATTFTFPNQRSTIRELSVREVGDGYAVCDCDAEIVQSWRHTSGAEGETKTFVRGPVTLGRTAEGWKVADYVEGPDEGRRFLESAFFYEPSLAYEGRGVRIAPLAARFGTDGTAFWLEAENRGTRRVAVTHAVMRAGPQGNLPFRHPWVAAAPEGLTTLDPGETATIAAYFTSVVIPLAKPSVDVHVFVDTGSRRPLEVRLRLPLAGKGRRARAWRPLPRRLQLALGWGATLALLGWILWAGGIPFTHGSHVARTARAADEGFINDPTAKSPFVVASQRARVWGEFLFLPASEALSDRTTKTESLRMDGNVGIVPIVGVTRTGCTQHSEERFINVRTSSGWLLRQIGWKWISRCR